MNSFSEKSISALGNYYVYGLIDPRTNKLFYVGKGTGNRVFNHEYESKSYLDDKKLKLKTIREIEEKGLEVKKIIINYNLSETQAFAAEASLINIFNYLDSINNDKTLTNIVSGHHSSGVMSVEEFEKIHGAEALKDEDIQHNILVIKINQLYNRNNNKKELYESVRGIWRASLERVQSVEYVFGVYNSLIVAVYKPTKWYRCSENPEYRPRQNESLTKELENRIYFVDDNYEEMDENAKRYYGKSIVGLTLNQRAQNPIIYLNPKN